MKKHLRLFLLIFVVLFLSTLISCNTPEQQNMTAAETVCEHDFSAWQTTKYQTCVDEGIKESKCSKCGETKTSVITPSGVHSYGEVTVTRAVTCTENGLETKVCTYCGYTKSDEIESSGHSYSGWIDVAGKKDCVTLGKRVKYCEICDDGVEMLTYGYHDYKNYKCTVCDQTATREIEYALNPDGKSYTVKSIDENAAIDKIVIMDIYNGLPVTSVNESFLGTYCAKEIIIPITVTNISYNAFTSSKNAAKVTVEKGNPKYHSDGNCIIDTGAKILVIGFNGSVIPTDGSVTMIGTRAFQLCRDMKSINIPNTVTYIGSHAFYGCKGLTSIEIPYSVSEICKHVFCWCSNLRTVRILGGATLGEGVFIDCGSLSEVYLNSDTKAIGKQCMIRCSSLAKINFEGPKVKWNAITKGEGWDTNTGEYTVYCTDGNIDKTER